MFKAVFMLKDLGKFQTLSEAFKAIYDAVKEEKVLMWQTLETTIWIKENGKVKPYSFYEARDIMCAEGYLVDGKWIDKGTPTNPQHGREPEKVRIEVFGGVAEATFIPDGITVMIIDHDNAETGEYVGTPVKDQSNEPKPKPLAQFIDEWDLAHPDERNTREYFQQALDAYESTEQVKIRIEQV